jgi:beta-phosphoglucomutase-like phosphatase (HAD superfamily)
VFEDAPKGVEAAENAGIPAVVLTTLHNRPEFAASRDILAFVADYEDEKLSGLFK